MIMSTCNPVRPQSLQNEYKILREEGSLAFRFVEAITTLKTPIYYVPRASAAHKICRNSITFIIVGTADNCTPCRAY